MTYRSLRSARAADAASSWRWYLPVLLGLWALFTAWCVSGFPPAVDLAAHGAQEETLVQWLIGDPAVRQVYGVHFPWGYGLAYWLFLPVAFVFNGAVAARCALWVALMLFPLSQLALARAFRRSDWALVLGLPLAFNVSYWYGLLSGLFAQPLAFFTLALFVRALRVPSRRRILWANLAAAATLQSHLVAFAAIAVAMGAVALFHRPRWPSLRTLALCLGLPALLALPKAWAMASRAVVPGPWPATEYNAASHFNWFFKTYIPEGRLAVTGPLATAVVFAGYWLYRRRQERLAPAVAFFALIALYLVTPKTLSGIFLVSVRLPVLAAMCSLIMVDWTSIAHWLRWGLALVAFMSLAETARFHWRFARAMDGLDAVMAGGPPGRNGYLSTAGDTVLGSRHIYLEHMGQWLTATRGGVGQNFFTDAEHHPVHALPGLEPARDLRAATPEQLATFDTVLVYGPGPLPPGLATFHEAERAGPWRRLVKP